MMDSADPTGDPGPEPTPDPVPRTPASLSAQIVRLDALVIDEASRVEDELYFAVLPMLAVTGGRLLALSTPFGLRGWWADAWHSNQNWKRVKIPATDVRRISREFLDEQRESMGTW